MLTQAHVRTLRDHPSPVVRADIAAAVSHDFAAGILTPAETDIAEQILEGLAQDVASQVRQALADHIRNCPFLPHNIAVILAHDLEESVALPVIEGSPLLGTDDLITIIRTDDVARQLAVARRHSLAEEVTDELVATGRPKVITVLLDNAGAEISDHSLLKIAVQFKGETPIESLLVDRSLLPFAVCGVLLASVSAGLRDRLVTAHGIPAFMATEFAMLGRERALTDILHSYEKESGEALALLLHQKSLLTATLLLRTLCVGDLWFFESAMSVRAELSLINTKILLYDKGSTGLRTLYRKTSLPDGLLPFFRIGVEAVLQGYLNHGRAVFTDHLIEQFVLVSGSVSPGNLEHVVAELAHKFGLEGETEHRAWLDHATN